ncbi:MAG: hypothetical protein ACI9YL_000821 [Luteibaculaceae bacterium]|jgi:hypothetical protein
MANKVIYAMFDDDHTLLNAACVLRDNKVSVKDVFSPFPIHGLDPVIGIKRTRLAICAFMYGLTGLSLATLGIWYFMIGDWPMNIGGKPSMDWYQNIPSFIPVTFEFTVLCAAHGMAITYFLRNLTLPGMPARNPDPRTTDDKFVMEIHTHGNAMEEDGIVNLLKENGSIELNTKEING